MDACCGFVDVYDGFDESGGSLFLDQVDRASAEAGACHAGSQGAGDAPGGLDEGVEFGAAHLVVVSQAVVGCVHECSEAVHVPVFEGFGDFEDSRVLGDDVAASASEGLGESVYVVELVGGYVSEGSDAWDAVA